jgi:hypothetical protein
MIQRRSASSIQAIVERSPPMLTCDRVPQDDLASVGVCNDHGVPDALEEAPYP